MIQVIDKKEVSVYLESRVKFEFKIVPTFNSKWRKCRHSMPMKLQRLRYEPFC